LLSPGYAETTRPHGSLLRETNHDLDDLPNPISAKGTDIFTIKRTFALFPLRGMRLEETAAA
jgi:hypothetical protein